MAVDHYVSVVEALLFASENPVSAGKIRGCFDEGEDVPVESIVEELNTHYDETERAFFIMEVAGGYQLVTRKEFEPYVKQLYVSSSRMRLSQAALETLAIVAYKQPVSRPDIDSIRGVNSDGVLRTLLERNLIDIKGREDAPGRPLLYATSDEFLRYFGLKSIKDLPKLKEIDELTLESEDIPEDTDIALEEPEAPDAEPSATE
ncbi:MAG: SMC-Scp complex subunit ScpB [Candidatus Marinimicrobia bacterium]|nr:SMC-Scp complex subunit ScpB [Candidatus Neomarinimicrobiota bacterium]MCF7828574.1 SMC-Scp complex subunit ScpB [Candidatus Neomarinimicrobiota bacterium]MCF7880315.1 SMC-Scp complex subunit ScpB [Candidatus Neomarinimicrobiota bacterium]